MTQVDETRAGLGRADVATTTRVSRRVTGTVVLPEAGRFCATGLFPGSPPSAVDGARREAAMVTAAADRVRDVWADAIFRLSIGSERFALRNIRPVSAICS